MKKVLAIAVLVMLSFGVYAAPMEYKVGVGIKNTGLDIEINKNSGSSLNSEINLNLDAEFDMFFKDGLGMNVIFGAYEKFTELNLGVGFAYNLPINANWDFLLTVGPTFGFAEKNNTLGFFCHFDFDFISGRYFFARLGTGLDLNYLTYGGGDAKANLKILIPVPRVAIGWKF